MFLTFFVKIREYLDSTHIHSTMQLSTIPPFQWVLHRAIPRCLLRCFGLWDEEIRSFGESWHVISELYYLAICHIIVLNSSLNSLFFTFYLIPLCCIVFIWQVIGHFQFWGRDGVICDFWKRVGDLKNYKYFCTKWYIYYSRGHYQLHTPQPYRLQYF